MQELEITVWEADVAVLHPLLVNLKEALRNLNMKASIQINSEPPHLARHGILGKTPVIEINASMWSLRQNHIITVEQFINLLRMYCKLPHNSVPN